MPGGRPTKTRLSKPLRGKAWVEVVVLNESDRLPIPASVNISCPWLSAGKEILAELRPDRIVALSPFDERSDIERTLGDLRSSADDENEDAVLALLRRYIRLRISPESRISVPKDIRLCLGLDPLSATYVNIIIRNNQAILRPGRESDYADAEAVLSDLDILQQMNANME